MSSGRFIFSTVGNGFFLPSASGARLPVSNGKGRTEWGLTVALRRRCQRKTFRYDLFTIPVRGDSAVPKKSNTYRRRLPIGAEPVPGGGVHFRVWAPIRRKVEVLLEKGPEGTAPGGGTIVPFQSEKNGYFSALVPEAGEGSYYRFRLDGSDRLLPDPASRFQPNGPFGASLVVLPETFEWSDGDWPGTRMAGQVIYEMHVGTFTQEGTWEAASRELPELK
jgi:maltooligosyltrehalose trehalohydrolase